MFYLSEEHIRLLNAIKDRSINNMTVLRRKRIEPELDRIIRDRTVSSDSDYEVLITALTVILKKEPTPKDNVHKMAESNRKIVDSNYDSTEILNNQVFTLLEELRRFHERNSIVKPHNKNKSR